jgi:hypothetical protein
MAKGKFTGGGSRAGVPNKATTDVRNAIAVFASAHAATISEWLLAVEDPGKRLDLYFRALEYHIPKLGRTELTGADEGPLQVSIVRFTDPK